MGSGSGIHGTPQQVQLLASHQSLPSLSPRSSLSSVSPPVSPYEVGPPPSYEQAFIEKQRRLSGSTPHTCANSNLEDTLAELSLLTENRFEVRTLNINQERTRVDLWPCTCICFLLEDRSSLFKLNHLVEQKSL